MKQEIEHAVPELPPTHSEVVGMTLLCELQPAIAKAIDSLGEKPTKSVTDLFYFYAAKHINIAVDAFILLRRERRVDGACDDAIELGRHGRRSCTPAHCPKVSGKSTPVAGAVQLGEMPDAAIR